MNFIKTFKNIVKATIKDDCAGMASEMAFNFILSLFPFFISITAIFGLIGTEDFILQIMDTIRTIAPTKPLALIEGTLKEIIKPSSGSLLTVSFIAGFIFASNAINVLMKVLNKAYSVPETRPFWKIRALSLWVIMIFVFAVFFITNVVIMGTVILQFLNEHFALPQDTINTILVARWPLTFILLGIIGFIVYYFMPNISINIKNRILSSLPGTVFFALSWLAVSRLFGLYIENFGMYNKVYGTLGTFIILLLWLYYTSFLILVGGEINSEVYKQIKTREN